ncbi:MAG TPA: hypothetical protein VGS22_18435 [Thermoanaerobaculia bacterium]|jgi:hypothetical protein|nr:hypothetical protein [Thermoanaerobaculia bacterium]
MASIGTTVLALSHRTVARGRYLTPTLVLMAAGVMLALSFWLPYCELTLVTPALPQGVRLVFYLNHFDGPLDSLLASAGNPVEARLDDLLQLERSLDVAMVTALCLLLVAAAFVRWRWAALLAAPSLAFPFIAIADTTQWLLSVVTPGISLHAPPTFHWVGRLAVDGIVLTTYPATGLFLAVASSLTAAGGLWFHFRAHQPAVQGLRVAGGIRVVGQPSP